MKPTLDPRTRAATLRSVARRLRRFAGFGDAASADKCTKAVNNTLRNWAIEFEHDAKQIEKKLVCKDAREMVAKVRAQ